MKRRALKSAFFYFKITLLTYDRMYRHGKSQIQF
jgi:hypothetical protein